MRRPVTLCQFWHKWFPLSRGVLRREPSKIPINRDDMDRAKESLNSRGSALKTARFASTAIQRTEISWELEMGQDVAVGAVKRVRGLFDDSSREA